MVASAAPHRDAPRAPGAVRLLAVLRRLALVGSVLLTLPLGQFIYLQENGGCFGMLSAFAVPVGLALGGWMTLVGSRWAKDRRALLRPDAPRRHGRWVAVTGVARPAEETFEEPVVGKPALASHYQVKERQSSASTSGGSRSSMVVRYEGFHLVPTVIVTDEGEVRLRGFPDLQAIPPTPPTPGTPFTLQEHIQPVRGGCLAAVLRVFGWTGLAHRGGLGQLLGETARTGREATARARPEVSMEPRFLWRPRRLAGRMDAAAIDRMYGIIESDDMERSSRVLRPDMEVCVLGRWGDDELLPSLHRPAGLPVYPGDRHQALAELGEDAGAFLKVGGLLLLGASVWLVVLLSRAASL